MRAVEAAAPRPEVLLVRVGGVLLFALVWWLMWLRNEGLRETERELALRAQLTREVRTLKVAVLSAQPQLPEPGTGDASWWHDRFTQATAVQHLQLDRFDERGAEVPMGPYALLRREVGVRGSYQALMSLLVWMETATPRMRLDSFTIEPLAPADMRATLHVLLPSPRLKR